MFAFLFFSLSLQCPNSEKHFHFVWQRSVQKISILNQSLPLCFGLQFIYQNKSITCNPNQSNAISIRNKSSVNTSVKKNSHFFFDFVSFSFSKFIAFLFNRFHFHYIIGTIHSIADFLIIIFFFFEQYIDFSYT